MMKIFIITIIAIMCFNVQANGETNTTNEIYSVECNKRLLEVSTPWTISQASGWTLFTTVRDVYETKQKVTAQYDANGILYALYYYHPSKTINDVWIGNTKSWKTFIYYCTK